jgi:hypothetical protein
MKQIEDEQIELIKAYIKTKHTLKVLEILNSLEEIKQIEVPNEKLS